jgi:predicted nucleotidyltransferase
VFDLGRLLSVLSGHDVEFIIVGGVAAALQGAPVVTLDVDIVHRIEDANLARLKQALDGLNAFVRGDPRELGVDPAELRTKGHTLISTDAGPLDVLGSMNDRFVYEDLIGSTAELEVTGHVMRVLSLERLIELKRALGRPKDVAMLPVLEATLRERARQ